MADADYTRFGGGIVEYNPADACRVCCQPVVTASMGGTDVCAWCDCGRYRDGTQWPWLDATRPDIIKHRAAELAQEKTDG